MIYVVSEHVGEMGGGAKSPLLLCETLRRCGYSVTLFVLAKPSKEIAHRLASQNIRVVTSLTRRLCRWRLPVKLLAFQVFVSALLEKPTAICMYSLWLLTRSVLVYPFSCHCFAWEATVALDRKSTRLNSSHAN